MNLEDSALPPESEGSGSADPRGWFPLRNISALEPPRPFGPPLLTQEGNVASSNRFIASLSASPSTLSALKRRAIPVRKLRGRFHTCLGK